MLVSTLPEPERHPLWPGIHRLLAKAAARLGSAHVWEPDDLLWIVIDDQEIVAVLSSRLLVDGTAEIVNGSGHRAAQWVRPMDEKLCQWARAAGAPAIICRGRKGWGRLGRGLGWKVVGRDGAAMVFRKTTGSPDADKSDRDDAARRPTRGRAQLR